MDFVTNTQSVTPSKVVAPQTPKLDAIIKKLEDMDKKSTQMEQNLGRTLERGLRRLESGDSDHSPPKQQRLGIHERVTLPRGRTISRERSLALQRGRPQSRGPPSRSNRPDALEVRVGRNFSRRPRSRLRVTRCPFCDTLECERPSMCGMLLPYERRMEIKARLGLCPEGKCFKAHTGACRKSDVKCSICNDPHHVLFCREGAEILSALKEQEQEEAKAGSSRSAR